ncbi:MAG: hypothetical protein OQJ87_10230 [Rhodospirillales bacterium]|nr:hypothetical protein [Rhodospirillales bacterium]
MTTELEYAYLALEAYAGFGNENTSLQIHDQLPVKWQLTLKTWGDGRYQPIDSDFYAVAYENTETNEIVIAYRGTDSKAELLTDA